MECVQEPDEFDLGFNPTLVRLRHIKDGSLIYAPPSWVEFAIQYRKVIIFFDELTTARPAVQAAALRIILEKKVGDYALPPETRILAAANPPEIAADGWDLAPPLANRLVHIEWELDPEDWVENFPLYWGREPRIDTLDPELWRRARVLIASFIHRNPAKLFVFPSDPAQQGKAWPSPRSWDAASRNLAATWQLGGSTADAARPMAGAVGEGAAHEFISWASELDLPDPEELLADPRSFRAPARGDHVYTVLNAVITAALANLTPERWKAAWQIIGIAADQAGPDIAAFAAQRLAKAREKRPDLSTPREALRFVPILKELGIW